MIAKFFSVSVWVSELNLKDLRFCKRLAVGFVFMLSSSFLSENNLIYKSYIPLTRYITDILARGPIYQGFTKLKVHNLLIS